MVKKKNKEREGRSKHRIIIEDVDKKKKEIYADDRVVPEEASLLLKQKMPGWGVVFVSLGDCKVFKWKTNGDLTDITRGNRSDMSDPKDCGGRIGPSQMDKNQPGLPDLRNLRVYFSRCHAGDILFVVSDGVYDNIDPQFAGKYPSEFGLEVETWEEVSSTDMERVKSDFFAKSMKTIFKTARDDDQLSRSGESAPSLSTDSDEEDTKVKPQHFMVDALTNALIDHTLNITKPLRVWMEDNPGQRQPSNVIKYPGKLDHTTCLTIRVGETQT